MKKVLPFALACLLLAQPAICADKSLADLRRIAEAGGGFILDLDKKDYTVSELVSLASSLKYQATLTIKVGGANLSTSQCAQIAKARPGQVVFWF